MSSYASSSSERAAQALLFAICGSGAVLNLLLLIAALRSQHVRRKPFNVLMIAGIMADLLVQLVGVVETAVTLHNRTIPDARPNACHTQATLALLSGSVSILCMTATAISRFYVIVKKKQLTRSHYAYMVLGCITLAMLNVLPIMLLDPSLAKSNRGRLVCLVKWANSSDSKQLYVTISNLILWNGAVAVEFASFFATYRYIKQIKVNLGSSVAVDWNHSAEILQFKRLFLLAVGLTLSWCLMAGQVWFAAISGSQVPPGVDQTAIMLVVLFYLLHSVAVLRMNQPLRQSLVALLSCRRQSSVLPGAGGSHRLSFTEDTTVVEGSRDITVMSPTPREIPTSKRKTLDPNRNSHTSHLMSPSKLLIAGLDKHYSYQNSMSRFSHGDPRYSGGTASLRNHSNRQSLRPMVQIVGSPVQLPFRRFNSTISDDQFARQSSLANQGWPQSVLTTPDFQPQPSTSVGSASESASEAPAFKPRFSITIAPPATEVHNTVLDLPEPLTGAPANPLTTASPQRAALPASLFHSIAVT